MPNGSHRGGRGPIGSIEEACGGETSHQIDGVHRVVDLDSLRERDLVGIADDLWRHKYTARNALEAGVRDHQHAALTLLVQISEVDVAGVDHSMPERRIDVGIAGGHALTFVARQRVPPGSSRTGWWGSFADSLLADDR